MSLLARSAERAWALRCLLLALAGLAFLGRGLLRGHSLLAADVGLCTYPALDMLGRLWRSGSLPLWNPHMGLGGPLLGDAGLAPCYPGNALLLFLSPLTALNVLVVSHLALCALGFFKLARRLELSPLASCLTAFAVCLGGVSLGQINTPPYVLAFAWVPFAILGLERVVNGERTLRARLLAAAPFALIFLAGCPETCLLAALLAWVLAQLRRRRPWATTAQLALTGLLAAGLTAFVLVPTLLAVVQSDRAAGLDLAMAGRWSLHPAELLGLIVPSAIGEGRIPLSALGLEARPWFNSLYFGVVPLACASYALKRSRPAWLLAIAAGVFLLFALGVYTPVYRALHPLVSWVRYPAKLALPFVVLLALAAGIGLDRLRAQGRRGLSVALAALGGVALLTAVLAWLNDAPVLARNALQPACVAALAAGAVWQLRRPRRALVFLALVDLLVAGHVGTTPRAVLERRPSFVESIQQAEQEQNTPLRVVTLERTWLTGVSLQGESPLPGLELSEQVSRGAEEQLSWREALCPNAGMPHGIRTLRAFTPLLLARTARLRSEAKRRGVDRDALFGRQGVNLLLYAEADEPATRPLLARAGPYRLAWLEGARPWVSLTDRVQRVDDGEAALEQVLSQPASNRTVVEAPPSTALPREDPPPSAGRVWPLSIEFDALAFEVDCERPCLLVVREAWAPDWQVSVNGEPAPLLPADYVFRSVVVPAGKSVVVFEYNDRAWRLGVALTASSLLLLLLLAALRRRRKPHA